MQSNKLKIVLPLMLVIITLGFIYPENLVIPVKDATISDWNKNSFWYEPWGKSVTHKGIDVFANKGSPALSASDGIVLYTGKLKYGGKVVIILGPKWRVHYFCPLRKHFR
ncbi:MAG: M23 family metallopeptidase [Enterobacterales bacterium]|nr:M23 family metallopeptidase [Enterobacterales bacterium]